MPRLLDLFAGRLGWSKAFLERGWDVVAIDLTLPTMEIPERCTFLQLDILKLGWLPTEGLVYCRDDGTILTLGFFDYICASSSCEEFSLFGMSHFHPNPPYPSTGIKLFNHTRHLCESSGVNYIMENTNRAQDFVGKAENHAGPFYLWGNSVPMLMPMGIKKGIKHAEGFRKDMTQEEKRLCRLKDSMLRSGSKSKVRKEHTAIAATIPAELSACIADYAERLLEVPQ